MQQREKLTVEKKTVDRWREKWNALAVKKVAYKHVATERRKAIKARLDQVGDAVFAQVQPRIEVLDHAEVVRDLEPEDAILAARVENLYKQLGELVTKCVKYREEVPQLVSQVVTKQMQDTSQSALSLPPGPAESVGASGVSNKLALESVDRNVSALLQTLARLLQSYPATLEKAKRINNVAFDQVKRGPSHTESVIQQELEGSLTIKLKRASPAKKR